MQCLNARPLAVPALLFARLLRCTLPSFLHIMLGAGVLQGANSCTPVRSIASIFNHLCNEPKKPWMAYLSLLKFLAQNVRPWSEHFAPESGQSLERILDLYSAVTRNSRRANKVGQVLAERLLPRDSDKALAFVGLCVLDSPSPKFFSASSAAARPWTFQSRSRDFFFVEEGLKGSNSLFHSFSYSRVSAAERVNEPSLKSENPAISDEARSSRSWCGLRHSLQLQKCLPSGQMQ